MSYLFVTWGLRLTPRTPGNPWWPLDVAWVDSWSHALPTQPPERQPHCGREGALCQVSKTVMRPWFNHETTDIYGSLSKWPIYYQTSVLFGLGGHIKTLKNSRRNTAYSRHRNYFEMDHGPHGEAKTVQLPEENEGECLHDLGGPDHEGAERNF